MKHKKRKEKESLSRVAQRARRDVEKESARQARHAERARLLQQLAESSLRPEVSRLLWPSWRLGRAPPDAAAQRGRRRKRQRLGMEGSERVDSKTGRVESVPSGLSVAPNGEQRPCETANPPAPHVQVRVRERQRRAPRAAYEARRQAVRSGEPEETASSSSSSSAASMGEHTDPTRMLPSTPTDTTGTVNARRKLSSPSSESRAATTCKRATDMAPATPAPTPAAAVRPPPNPPTFPVPVPRRSAAMQAARMALPVCGMEQEIMEAVSSHDVVFIVGETGSGKTTQVPQFLYEAGYAHTRTPEETAGLIAVVQPRRLAAVWCAHRVAVELGFGAPTDTESADGAVMPDATSSSSSSPVGYQVRHEARRIAADGRAVPATDAHAEPERIRFVTDGILLRYLESDILLRHIRCVVLDEAHERSVHMDLLLGILSRTVRLRRSEPVRRQYPHLPPLKVMVMSATADVEALARLPFLVEAAAAYPGGGAASNAEPDEQSRNGPAIPTAQHSMPVLRVSARQHPVTVHFARHTPVDYVREAVRKCCQIHQRLPPGDILVFLPGRREIQRACQLLDEASRTHFDQSLQTLPLYAALLPWHRYAFLFREKHPQPGASGRRRLCVVATNVAETSLTLPGIRYVVDSGRVRQVHWSGSDDGDNDAAIAVHRVQWTSQASAEQRAGRAGRTGPGHCYRLYSAAVFTHQFAAQSAPEVQRMPLDAVVLRLAALGVQQPAAFPWVSAPPPQALQRAQQTLQALGAIRAWTSDEAEGEAVAAATNALTPTGRQMARLPVAPRLARMLLWVQDTDASCLPYAIRLAAALSTTEQRPLLMVDDRAAPTAPSPTSVLSSAMAHPHSEPLGTMRALCAAEYAGRQTPSSSSAAATDPHASLTAFCTKHRLEVRVVREWLRAVRQLERLMAVWSTEDRGTGTAEDASNDEGGDHKPEAAMPPAPTAAQERLLRQALLVAFVDRVARRWSARASTGRKTGGRRAHRYECSSLPAPDEYAADDDSDQIASGRERGTVASLPCVAHLRDRSGVDPASDVAAYLVYTGLFYDTSRGANTDSTADSAEDRASRPPRIYLQGATCIDPRWIATAAAASPACRLGAPLATPAPRYDARTDQVLAYVRATYPHGRWMLPLSRVPLPPFTRAVDGDGVLDHRALCTRLFAHALLLGEAVPAFPPPAVRDRLSPAPAALLFNDGNERTVGGGWFANHRAVLLLLSALRQHHIYQRRTLLQTWRQQPLFLLREFLLWVPAADQIPMQRQWPELVHQLATTTTSDIMTQ